MEQLPTPASPVAAASAEAVAAARQSDEFALVLAVVRAQQLVAQQSVPVPARQAPRSVPVGRWLAIGAGASVFLLTVAVSAVAVAVCVVALTICVLVLRGLWADWQKGRG